MSKQHTREMNGQTQVNVGACRVCGDTVWATVGSKRHAQGLTLGGPIHARLCADRKAQERPSARDTDSGAAAPEGR